MKRNRKFSMERLEDRQLMAGDLAVSAIGLATDLVLERNVPVVPAVPAYSSNPGAAATVYLDFNGHFEAQWGDYRNATTPVFSMDADTTSFSSSELSAIKEVWQRMAEDFAPFNINVTTVNPGNFDNGRALRVAIGGSGLDWYHEPIGGVSLLNSFTNSLSNTVYVFNSQSSNVSARVIADLGSHEVGHAFGLYHQSVVDANGNLVSEYARGTNEKSPIMGLNYDSQRSTWWNGTTSHHFFENYMVQDDMAAIASAKNGFSYRPDDRGNTWQTALAMGPLSYGSVVSQSGIIGQTSDTDWFQFNVTSNGRISLQANVAQVGANLDARMSLFRLEHQLVSGKVVYNLVPVASSDPSTSLNASISTNLTPGNYFAVVGSHGEYGDVGQYTLQGSFSQPLTIPDTKFLDSRVLTAAVMSTPATTTVVGSSVVTSGMLTSEAQLLAAPMSSPSKSSSVLPATNLVATPTSLRTAAIDEAFATSVREKSHKLPAEVFDLLATGL